MSGSTTGWRALILVLGFAFCALQLRLWLSDKGWSDVVRLRSSVIAQRNENAELSERNSRLRAEVGDLKEGFAALEERARADLGMIAEQESFYLLVPAATESRDRDD